MSIKNLELEVHWLVEENLELEYPTKNQTLHLASNNKQNIDLGQPTTLWMGRTEHLSLVSVGFRIYNTPFSELYIYSTGLEQNQNKFEA